MHTQSSKNFIEHEVNNAREISKTIAAMVDAATRLAMIWLKANSELIAVERNLMELHVAKLRAHSAAIRMWDDQHTRPCSGVERDVISGVSTLLSDRQIDAKKVLGHDRSPNEVRAEMSIVSTKLARLWKELADALASERKINQARSRDSSVDVAAEVSAVDSVPAHGDSMKDESAAAAECDLGPNHDPRDQETISRLLQVCEHDLQEAYYYETELREMLGFHFIDGELDTALLPALEVILYPFEYADLNNMMNHSKTLQYKEKHLVNDMEITLYETGHIIGGSSILVEVEGKRIFYTGDINKRGSKLLRPADLDLPEVDILIIESTYSQTEQAPREESEKNLVQFAYDVIERGGTLFIPAFSVERAQEIACVLKATDFKHRISMDGMALKANEIMLRNPSFLRDPDGFKKIITEVEWVKGWHRRKHLVKEPGVIISPAGMLVGGTALFYLQEIAKNPNNGIALVSYQGKGTPGRLLLEKGLVSYNGKTKKSLAEVKHYEFSGHSSRTELFEILGKIKGNPKVLTVHGDDMSCTKFASEIKEKYGFDAIAPDNGQIVEVN